MKPTRAGLPTHARIAARARIAPRPRTPARSPAAPQPRSPAPPPAAPPRPARTPARARTPTRARTPARPHHCASPDPDSPLMSLGSPSVASPEATPEPEQDFTPIKRPANTSISHVKSIFAELYPDCGGEEQDAQYVRFRNRLDQLTSIHLDSSLALSHQDKDCLKTVNDELVKGFPWLARCPNTWPVAVCLQGKLHNSAARSSEKTTRKLLTSLRGTGRGK
ncbi:hypothetical protein K438DRAFT_1989565 [Mycena galopus ATCC 62051]|nr:hypothetical protein K438DRAFT_1989565 [Mycena galopus ATCC 62051]